MNKLIIAISLFMFIHSQGVGQDIEKDSIIVRAKVYEDSIALRWAPTNHILWQQLNQYGYTIERFTIIRDSTVLNDKPKFVLSTDIRPYPANSWLKIIDENDYAAIAAQAIYGESFEVSTGDGADIASIVNQVQEQEMRFAYGLLAADMSYEVAKMEGLAFVDTAVVNSEKYLYRVYANLPDTTVKTYGYVFSGASDNTTLPVLPMPKAEFGDRKVVLSWRTHEYKDIYTGYFIERSEDSLTYERLNKVPYVNLHSGKDPGKAIKVDSLPGNNLKYYYRIVGVDAFGDEGEPSSSVSGMGAAPVNTRAVLTNGLVVNNGESVKLQWTFPDEDEGMIKGFSIERSISTKGPYKSINNDLLQANERMYIDGFPNATNYYQIVTFGTKGEVKRSHPILVQLQDSIPPDTPKGLIGLIDSTGVVTMKWQANTEQDLLGYRVYRSNFQNSEFSRITASHLSSAIFYDTINIKTLTKDIYYKISAIDNRFNESVISESYVIRKPDIIKPVLPVFKSLKLGNDGVNISWINSSSSDVAKHVLYRKKEGDNEWQYVQQFHLEIQNYKDTEVFDSGKYSYTLVAVDKSGNESEPAKPLIANVSGRELYNSDVFEKVYIDKSKDSQAIFLKWKAGVGVKRILIFRGMADQQVTLYKSVDGSLTSFNDSSVLKKIVYKYRIQAEFSDGSRSLMSEEVSLEL